MPNQKNVKGNVCITIFDLNHFKWLCSIMQMYKNHRDRYPLLYTHTRTPTRTYTHRIKDKHLKSESRMIGASFLKNHARKDEGEFKVMFLYLANDYKHEYKL